VTAEDEARELERELLLDALGELGEASGRLGGQAGGGLPGAVGGASGGRKGARWTGKRLREDRNELELEVPASPDEAIRVAAELLAHEGELVEAPLPELGHPEVWAIVGTGFGRMNPAVTRVGVRSAGEGRCRVTVIGVAKEGLIKQHGGRKAAERVRDGLVAALR
jgi:hypothetical protein